MSHKKPYLEKSTAFTYSLKRKYALAFESKCQELNVNKSAMMQELIVSFLSNRK
jgi:hypothetical protein